MYRLCHIAHKGFDVGHGGGAVLGKELDDGAADDGTIADFGHGGSLLRGGNAKADGAGRPVFWRIRSTMAERSVLISLRVPVTPREETM